MSNATYYYYEQRDGTVLCTTGLDPFLCNDSGVRRAFRMDGDRLKCIHDNDSQPWGYHLGREEGMLIILRAEEPVDSKSLLDPDDFY